MASIAKLVVSLGADIAGFTSGFDKASRHSKRTMAQIERDAAKIGKSLAVGLAAAATAITALTVRAINAADKIRDLSLATGVSVETLSAYAVAADKSGVSLDTLGKGLGKMQRSLSDANEGMASQVRAFERLGLSISELLSLSPEQQFAKIAGAISQLGNAAQRTATAQEIFGRSGAQLLPLLLEGEQGLNRAREAAEKYGAVISTEFAESADAFNDNLRDMRSVTDGLAKSFAEGILPALIQVQRAMLDQAGGFDTAKSAGETFGEFIKNLTVAFVALKAVAEALGRVIIAIFATLANAAKALLAPLTSLTTVLGAALEKLASNDLQGAFEELKNLPDEFVKEWEEASKGIADAGIFAAEGFVNIKTEVDNALAVLNRAPPIIEQVSQASGDLVKSTKRLEVTTKDAQQRIIAIRKEFDKYAEILEQTGREQEEFNARLQELRDIGDPIGAMVREFDRQLSDLNRALKEGTINAEEYRRILNTLSDSLGKAAASTQDLGTETEVLSARAIEAINILERSFTSAWESILSGGEDVLDGLADGFKTLIAGILHDLTTAPIVAEFKRILEAIQTEGIGGAIAGIDLKKLFPSLAGIIGVLGGAAIGGGGQGANIGSAIGTALGHAILPGLGSIIGGILGGLAGGLFDSDRPAGLELSGFSKAAESSSDIDAFVDTVFGRTFVRARRLDAEAIEQVKTSVEQFDAVIGSFIDDDQLAKITDALKTWIKGMEGEAISAEEFLSSRFQAILATFTSNIQDFVRQASSLEDQTARLGVAVSAEKIFEQFEGSFSGRTFDDFLRVIDAFSDRTTDITTAFNQVLLLLDQINAATTSLREFADSDLALDFQNILRLQNETPFDTLSRLANDFFDAIADFDGSPDQLIAIANQVQGIRAAEIAALQQIDAIQKGINSNLDKLRQDILGIFEGPKSGREIFTEAASLVDLVQKASTPEEIADLASQFDALIRSFSQEDVERIGDTLIDLIDRFQAASNTSLEQVRQNTLDSGESLRQIADAFLAEIPDALALIASTNERAAAALEAIAGTPVAPIDIPAIPQDQGVGAITESLGAFTASTDALFTSANGFLGQIPAALETIGFTSGRAATALEAIANTPTAPVFVQAPVSDSGLGDISGSLDGFAANADAGFSTANGFLGKIPPVLETISANTASTISAIQAIASPQVTVEPVISIDTAGISDSISAAMVSIRAGLDTAAGFLANIPDALREIAIESPTVTVSVEPAEVPALVFDTSQLERIAADINAAMTRMDSTLQGLRRIPAALEQIAANQQAPDLAQIVSAPEDAETDPAIFEDALELFSENLNLTMDEAFAVQAEILRVGTGQMSSAISTGVNSMSLQLAQAIVAGFQQADIQLNVIQGSRGFVQQ